MVRRPLIVFLLFCSCVLFVLWAEAAPRGEPRTHTVASGQRLESIARRYNVTIDAICTANGIRKTDKLRVGQKLVIPTPDDKDGNQARAASGRKAPPSAPAGRKASAERVDEKLEVHVVAEGQTLGRIARRYNVPVDALTFANGLRTTDRIRPGDRLIVPAADDTSGARARKLKLGGYLERHGGSEKQTTAPTPGPKATVRPASLPRIHTVHKGESLITIAAKHGVSVDALRHANGVEKSDVIVAGHKLVIPSADDEGGRSARRLVASGTLRDALEPGSGDGAVQTGSWLAYARKPARRGYVHLVGYNESFKGQAYGKNQKLLPSAREGIGRVLGLTGGSRPKPDERLLHLLVKVSDTFGGRPLRIVSGYRLSSFFRESRHKVGRAVDFSVVGVPNEAVKDYLRTFSEVGIGYYPNSTFVHLDVRETTAYWVDYSGPGEAPRRTPKPTRVADRDREASDDDEAGQVVPGADQPEPAEARPEPVEPEVAETGKQSEVYRDGHEPSAERPARRRTEAKEPEATGTESGE